MMLASRDSPMDDSLDPNEVVLNRINLQLARSRSILQSWRSQKSEDVQDEGDNVADDDDFFTFGNGGEAGGIGAKVEDNDDSPLPSRRSAQKEKLLEQLIGKKAANAKKKQDAHKGMSASKHAAPKPLTSKPAEMKAQEDSEDEEEGRAAAFGSKKTSKPEASRTNARGTADDAGDGVDAVEMDSRDHSSHGGDTNGAAAKSVDSRPQKRKAGGSYLDELLSKKGKNKKKQKT